MLVNDMVSVTDSKIFFTTTAQFIVSIVVLTIDTTLVPSLLE